MSTLVIEELGGKHRKLTLQGSGLPLRGAEWGGEMVMDTTWLPGSPVATQQVMGPTEAPSEWEGEWRTNRLVSLPCLFEADDQPETSVVLADNLRSVMDAIRVSGQLLRVTWVAKPGRRRVRYGRLKKFTTNDERADDLAWHANFEWNARDAQAAAVTFDTDQTLASTTACALSATDAASRVEAQAIITAKQATPGGASPFSLGQLEALADAPHQLAKQFARFATSVSSRMKQLADIIRTAKDQPNAVLNQVVDASTSVVEGASAFVQAITQKGPEAMSTDASVRSLLTAASYFSHVQDGAEKLALSGAAARTAAARRQSAAGRVGTDPRSLAGPGDLLAVVVPRPGETFLTISRRFYQGDDLSFELARANGLPGSTVIPPRTSIIVPRREVLAKFRMTA